MEHTQKIKDKLIKQKEKLFKVYHLKKMALFGSSVRNDYSELSDIDILVEFDQPIGIEFIDLALELERILGKKVDLVSRKGIKKNYFKEIEKDLVYV